MLLIIPERGETKGDLELLQESLPVILITLLLKACTHPSSKTQKTNSDPCHLRIYFKAPLSKLYAHIVVEMAKK